MRLWHDAHGTSAYPAPPDIAVQMYVRAIHATMFAEVHFGLSNREVIASAKNELEELMRWDGWVAGPVTDWSSRPRACGARRARSKLSDLIAEACTRWLN